MDAGVYDHIQSEALARDTPPRSGTATPSNSKDGSKQDGGSGSSSGVNAEPGNIATDLQETYKTLAASPWGAKLGGLWGSVNRQAASYIQEAQKEASAAGQTAFKGFTDLRNSLEGRARGFSGSGTALAGEAGAAASTTETGGSKSVDGKAEEKTADGTTVGTTEKDGSAEDATSPAFISRFRSEAARRLADLQKAEDAADEALLKFGTNIRNFLRDAVTVTPPTETGDGDASKDAVLFESKDADGKRVIHTTRFDAQLHVIHCSLDSFTKDPASAEYERWQKEFDANAKTTDIARDLDRYEELRRAMEKLVPERVEYGSFWMRYYFLRMVIESEEKRRREMLKAAASKSSADDADLAWDEDSDEEGGPSTPQPRASQEGADGAPPASSATPLASSGHLREPRKSHDEKSTAGSESSYDLVSGATSAAPGSPQEKKDDASAGGKKKGSTKDDSDEEDWE